MSNQNKNSAFQMIADVSGEFQDLINVETSLRWNLFATGTQARSPT